MQRTYDHNNRVVVGRDRERERERV